MGRSLPRYHSDVHMTAGKPEMHALGAELGGLVDLSGICCDGPRLRDSCRLEAVAQQLTIKWQLGDQKEHGPLGLTFDR